MSAGDLVLLAQAGRGVYEILHVSDQKAWVRPLDEGSQCIVTVADLKLVSPKGAPVSRLN